MSVVQAQLHTLIDTLDESKLLKIFEFAEFVKNKSENELFFSDEEETKMIHALAHEERYSLDEVCKNLDIANEN